MVSSRRGIGWVMVLSGCGGAVVPAVGDTDDIEASSSGDESSVDPDPSAGDGSDDGPHDSHDVDDTHQPPTCGDGVAEGDEQCDGDDLLGQSCEAMGATGQLVCTADCTLDLCDCVWDDLPPMCGPAVCGNGFVEDGEDCDGSNEGVDGWTPTCDELLSGSWAGEPGCADECTWDTSGCMLCGNGILDDGETCDGDSPSCAELGMGVGQTACSDTCELETACSPCGNGVVDDGEVCDGEAVPTTCIEQGFAGGTVTCTDACAVDVTGCSTCGDGIVSGDEVCDPLFASPCVCTESCTLDTNSCISLVISEILYAPLADPDEKPGQWIEVYNPSDTAWDMQGCVVSGDLVFDSFDIDAPLVVPPGGYATLGAGTDPELGFTPDFPMPVGVGLFNDGDIIVITCGEVEVDTVVYGALAPWPTVPPGTSIATSVLDAVANDDGAVWCSGSTPFGPGHSGTPGAANDCP